MSSTTAPTPAGPAATGPAAVAGSAAKVAARLAGLSPVVDECPDLVELLETLGQVDGLIAKAVGLLQSLQATGDAEAATGVPVETWLSLVGRRTYADRRMLQTTADTLGRMPLLAAAFDAGDVSWAQVRALVCACHRLPQHLLDQIDAELGLLTVDGDIGDAEPDTLIHVISRVLDSIDPTDRDREERRRVRERFVALQPTLDGTGGSIYGELDPLGFAVIAEALEDPTPPHGRTRDHIGQDPDPDRAEAVRNTLGRRRADRLIDLCARDLHHRNTSGTRTRGQPPATPPPPDEIAGSGTPTPGDAVPPRETPRTVVSVLHSPRPQPRRRGNHRWRGFLQPRPRHHKHPTRPWRVSCRRCRPPLCWSPPPWTACWGCPTNPAPSSPP